MTFNGNPRFFPEIHEIGASTLSILDMNKPVPSGDWHSRPQPLLQHFLSCGQSESSLHKEWHLPRLFCRIHIPGFSVSKTGTNSKTYFYKYYYSEKLVGQ